MTDLFANKRLSETNRADALDSRSKLIAKNTPATMNKTLGVVKVIFWVAVYREGINRDSTVAVGRIKEHKKEWSIFTMEELLLLFPDHIYGP